MHVVPSRARILFAGWLLVLGWFAALPGLLPMAFAAAAWIDGEHGIELKSDASDATVVLTHGIAGKPHAQIHQHRLLGRLLTCCAVSPVGQADHVVHFSASSESVKEKSAAAPDAQEGVTLSPAITENVIHLAPPVDHGRAEFLAAERSRGMVPRLPAQQHALLI